MAIGYERKWENMGKHGIEFVKCCVNIKSIFQGLSVAFWVHHS
jgi:hypothetical protein